MLTAHSMVRAWSLLVPIILYLGSSTMQASIRTTFRPLRTTRPMDPSKLAGVGLREWFGTAVEASRPAWDLGCRIEILLS